MLASVRQIKTSNREFFFLVSFYETLISSPANQSTSPRKSLQEIHCKQKGEKKKKDSCIFTTRQKTLCQFEQYTINGARYSRSLKKNLLFIALLARDSDVLVFYIKLTGLFLTKISNTNLRQSQMGTVDEKATTEFSRSLACVFSNALHFPK